MYFHLPRRHRRKLLFPPGLLALAGLLWLGCVVVGSWQEQLSRKVVVQLTMPPRPTSDTIFVHMPRAYLREPEMIPFLYSQLFTLYSWQNIELNGRSVNDSISVSSISKAIKQIRTDTIPNCGIRIRLTSKVRYKTFIQLLDQMELNNQKKYLFDMYHGPFALYVLVDKYTPQTPIEPALPIEPVFLCGTNSHVIPIPRPSTVINRWELLFQTTEWRWPLWLLVVMTILANWRIVRAWCTA
jgi:hypothetical protein